MSSSFQETVWTSAFLTPLSAGIVMQDVGSSIYGKECLDLLVRDLQLS